MEKEMYGVPQKTEGASEKNVAPIAEDAHGKNFAPLAEDSYDKKLASVAEDEKPALLAEDEKEKGSKKTDFSVSSCTSENEEPLTKEDGTAEYLPKGKLEKRLYSVYKDETTAEILKISSYAIVVITVYSLFATLLSLIEKDPRAIIEILLTLAVPFVFVSVLRVLINAPRPYELYEFYEKKPKEKSGRSFPSRHVFSIFAIATALIPYNVFLGGILGLLGCLLGVFRVLLGMHFVRDVVAGGLIGILSAALGTVLFVLI